MIKLKGIGHVNLRVADQEVSKRFYRDLLGFVIAEEDPEHGGVFKTLGNNFHSTFARFRAVSGKDHASGRLEQGKSPSPRAKGDRSWRSTAPQR